DQLAFHTGKRIKPLLAGDGEIIAAIHVHYGGSEDKKEPTDKVARPAAPPPPPPPRAPPRPGAPGPQRVEPPPAPRPARRPPLLAPPPPERDARRSREEARGDRARTGGGAGKAAACPGRPASRRSARGRRTGLRPGADRGPLPVRRRRCGAGRPG